MTLLVTPTLEVLAAGAAMFTGAEAWSPWALQLTALLALAPQVGVAQKLAALYRKAAVLPESAVRVALHALTLQVATAAATVKGEAFGMAPGALLRFADPNSAEVEIEGSHAVLRRLDRIWGGHPTWLLETRKDIDLAWPGPGVGHMILIQGTASVNRRASTPYTRIALGNGQDIHLGPASLLLHRSLLAELLAAALAAGIDVVGRPADDVVVELAVGQLMLRGTVATLNGRPVRLNGPEARVLRRLARHPGLVVTREALASELGRAETRALDRIMLSLRNKLGDGLIATVYGTGYRLETSAPLIGAGPGVAAPRHPLDGPAPLGKRGPAARPGRGPLEPQPGRGRASLLAGGGPPLREFRCLPRRLDPQGQRRGPRVTK